MDVPLPLQTIYAELLDRSAAAAFHQAFTDPGFFTPKVIRERRYWYFQRKENGAQKQRYVGPETPELLARIKEHRQARDDLRERQSLVSTLARSAHLPRPGRAIGEILAALAKAGVFRLRGVLVGTVAFQTYSAMLGTRLPASAIQTGDIDIAQDRAVSVAVADETPTMLDVLRQVDPTFRAVPHMHDRLSTTAYATKDIRVDFLTPNRGPNTDAPARLPALQTDAEQLRFLDYLIRDAEPAVVLHGSGIYVRVPSPQRFGLHKLIIAQQRRIGSAKSEKDFRQAEVLLAVLAAKRPADLIAAWQEATNRGRRWEKYLLSGLRSISLSVRDEVLRVVRVPRASVPGSDLTYNDAPVHYDFAGDVVTFLAESGGEKVSCAISREALEDHFGADDANREGRIQSFRAHRQAIENMARTKFLHWPVEQPASILIKSGDVADLRRRTGPTRPARRRT